MHVYVCVCDCVCVRVCVFIRVQKGMVRQVENRMLAISTANKRHMCVKEANKTAGLSREI